MANLLVLYFIIFLLFKWFSICYHLIHFKYILIIAVVSLAAQADQEVMRATGRADPDNSPSTLSKTVEKLISDLTGLFKNGISRFFRDSDDDEDDLSEDQNSTDEDHNENKNRDIGG